ncbi:hypothetical protein G9A89_004990 [Geosiphon pyriformis]|nr:hypothetical protein G9A89_004990 [Geosiphon pyriformis]
MSKIGAGGFGYIYKAKWEGGFGYIYKATWEGRSISFTNVHNGITQNSETVDYGFAMHLAKHGDMGRYLSSNFHSINWRNKLYIGFNIAGELGSIHSAGIVHCDLHAGNILQIDDISDLLETLD